MKSENKNRRNTTARQVQGLLSSTATWQLLLVVIVILMLLMVYGELSIVSAGFAFTSSIFGLAWYKGSLATSKEAQGKEVQIKETQSKHTISKGEQVIWPQLIQSIPEPIIILGAQKKVLYANQQAKDIFNIRQFGSDITTIFRTPQLLEAISMVTDNKDQMNIQITERTPIERQFSVDIAWVSGIEKETNPEILMHFRDLTEQERLNRMRSDFITNASHELRTPLASLQGFIETLQGPARNDEAAREKFLSIMAVQGKRMTNLVDDLLSLSRVEMNIHNIPKDKVDMVNLLRNTMDSLMPLAEAQKISLEFEPPTNDLIALGDMDELSQVFQNLIHNAIKYGRSDGQGFVRVMLTDIKRDKNNKPRLEVIIKDNGIGIDPHHIPRLTERFYRVDVERSREKGGTGLGLAIVKHIITRHHGELKINSLPGEGATFSVLLLKA